MSQSEFPGRILAIEPDAERGAALQRVLGSKIDAEVSLAASIEDALASIAQQIPDLILTSTFLPPADELLLIQHLRQSADASHTQIITVPHFLETPDAAGQDGSDSRVLRFARKREPSGALRCDANLLRQQVAEYLEQARWMRLTQGNRESPVILAAPTIDHSHSLDHREPAAASAPLMVPAQQDAHPLASEFRMPSDRRRAYRRRAMDLAGQLGIRLPRGGQANIVDISRLGVLLETRSKLSAGSLMDLQVLGINRTHSVAARLVRSEIVEANGMDVKYRVAAVFTREVDLFAATSAVTAAESHAPKVLGDLLGRVLADANWVANGASLHALFEEEVSRLVFAHEVRICTVPSRPPLGCQSLSFNIPGTGAAQLGLQVVFERGHQPTPAEIRLLKAAANLASVVLDLAPAGLTHSPIN